MLRRVSGFPPFFPLPGKSEYNFSIIKKKWNKFREFRSGTLFRYTYLELRLFLFIPRLPLIDNLAPKCPGIFLCVLLQTNAPWSDGDLGRLGGSARMATLAWQGIERFSVRLNQPRKKAHRLFKMRSASTVFENGYGWMHCKYILRIQKNY